METHAEPAVKNNVQFGTAAKIALLRQAVRKAPASETLRFELSEALAELGEAAEAATVFREAFILHPGAFATPWTVPADDQDQPNPRCADKARERALSLIQHGVIFSSVIAALAIGEAFRSNDGEVRKLLDYDRFFRVGTIVSPADWNLDEFNSALADEIRSDLRFYDVPADRSIRKAWRNNRILDSDQPVSKALSKALRAAVEQYITQLPSDDSHPFIASRPCRFTLRGWAVVSDGESYHRSHIHPEAWMSGVYYVARPPVSREPDSRRGWLSVAPPRHILGSAGSSGWESRFVEPEPGNLVLMPGYFYHQTHPMGVDEERICVAFDVVPDELLSSK